MNKQEALDAKQIMQGYELRAKVEALTSKLSKLEQSVQTELSCGRAPVITISNFVPLDEEYRAVERLFGDYEMMCHPDRERMEKLMYDLIPYVQFEKQS